MSEQKGPSGQDRRKHKRLPDIFMVTYRLKTPFALVLAAEGKEYAGVGVDIGEAGIGVDLADPITPGALVRMKFRLFNDVALATKHLDRTFQLEGECRYCEQTPNQSHRAGILFKNAGGEDREFISVYIKDQTLAKME